MTWFNNKKKRLLQLILLILTVVLIGLSFFIYSFNTREDVEKNYKALALKSNSFQETMIEDKLNHYLRTLHSFSLIASEYDDMKNPHLLNILNENSDQRHFVRMSIADHTGTTYTSDGKTYDSSDRMYFKESMKGNDYISNVLTSRVDKTKVIVMSTPIYRNNKIVGAVYNTISVEDLKEILNMQAMSDDFSSNIIEQSGVYVTVKNTWKDDNYFAYLYGEGASEKEMAKIKQNVQSDKQEASIVHVQGKLHYVYTSPIKNTDWIVVTSLDNRLIEAELSKSMQDTSELAIRILSILLLIGVYIVYSDRRANREMRNMNKKFDIILSNMPSCMLRFPLHNPSKMEFINDEFYNLCGYSKEEFQARGRQDFRDLILEEDQKLLLENLQKDRKLNTLYTYTYRVKHKDGSIVWVYEHRHLAKDETGIVWCYSNLVNFTELKSTRQKLKISEERYQMIIEQTESVVFDWDLLTDTITFSSLWERKYGYQSSYSNFLSVITVLENAEPMTELLDAMIRGEKRGSCEVHLPLLHGDYNWCKVSAQSTLDENGYLINIFGSIDDIDDIKEKTRILEEKVKQDGMTKVLNKVTIETLIKQTISSAPALCHLLIILDIDDFKNINDQYGHDFGDKVLMKISEILRTSFRQNDRIGRIGGDEFVVFMSNLDNTSNEFIEAKLCSITIALDNLYFEEYPEFSVTCSIGAALYPLHGKTFKDLFKSADKALYQKKRNQKNGYCYFNEIEKK